MEQFPPSLSQSGVHARSLKCLNGFRACGDAHYDFCNDDHDAISSRTLCEVTVHLQAIKVGDGNSNQAPFDF